MPDLLQLRYHLAFIRRDREALQRLGAEGRAKPEVSTRIWHFDALIAAREGRLDDARAAEQRAVAIAQGDGKGGIAAIYLGSRAIFEALAGMAGPARTAAHAALQLSDGRDATYAAAFALARIGDSERAAQLAASLAKRFPEDTSVKYSYLPTLHAMAALHANDPAKALAILEEARPYELAVPALAFLHIAGTFYPVFVRGEAYLALGRKADAAAEFRRILSHRGLLLADPIGPMAERALATLGGP
ncbi:MAG TPA: hypothetical protein VF491_21675 [Vicinamibacterales bacterium]